MISEFYSFKVTLNQFLKNSFARVPLFISHHGQGTDRTSKLHTPRDQSTFLTTTANPLRSSELVVWLVLEALVRERHFQFLRKPITLLERSLSFLECICSWLLERLLLSFLLFFSGTVLRIRARCHRGMTRPRGGRD